MDKNKTRTDLLAAGRKRLQQYRQKKDGKGSSSVGKSSKKSGRPEEHESDADAATSASMSMTSSHFTDGKVETDINNNLDIKESSGLQNLASPSTPEFNAPLVDSSSVAITYDAIAEAELASNIELERQAQGVDEADSELSIQNEGQSTQDVGAVTENVDSAGGSTDDRMSAPVDLLYPSAPLTTAVSDSIRIEREDEEREESLPLSEEISGTSLTQTREDQVTDDADGLDTKKSFQSCDTEIDGQKSENTQALLRIASRQGGFEEASQGANQSGKAFVVSSSFEDIMSDKFSASTKGCEDEMAGTVLSNLERETFPGSSHEELHLSREVEGHQEQLNQQYAPVGSAFVDKNHKLSIGDHEVNSAGPLGVSPIFDVSAVDLLQLTEIINGLSEEEYQFLLKSRRTVSNVDSVASVSVSPDRGFPELFERLKEELLLANLMNDILSLQLTEERELEQESNNHRYQLIDELSQLRASHSEINEKNQHLAEELVDCRVELHNVASKSTELQNQFNSAKAEAEALSARVLDLQNSFEMSRKDSLDLSTELADCRGLITALEVENEGINERLALIIEEKNKLEEEKEFHIFESKKLSTELADFKSSMEGLKVENSNLSAKLSLMTEESNKIETEAGHLTREIDSLSTELVESKDLVASLQLENSNLKSSLELSSDQMKNLEEEKQSVVLETHILSSLIVSIQEQLSIEKGERVRLEVDLKEATMHLEQLTKENIFLNSTLDVHKAKIKEIDDKHCYMLSQHAQVGEEQSKGREIAIAEDPLNSSQVPIDKGAPAWPPLNLLEQVVYDDSLGFVSLRMHLDEMEKILVELEEAIDCLRSQSVSFARSDGLVSSPKVSKLIQAYDSKAHQDQHEVERKDSSETQIPSDPYMLTKEQIKNLRAVLAQWRLNVQNVGALFKEERDNIKTSDAKYNELKDQDEALKQHCANLEASNIELAVQYETAMQLLGDLQEKKSDLEGLCEALKQEDIYCKAKNNKIYENLSNCQSKTSQLCIDINEIQQSSNHMVSVIGSQLENLQKEVTERAMLLEQGWNTTVAEIVEVARKLDESVGENFSSTISTIVHDGLYINHRLAVSVNAATEVIVDLRKKLEAAHAEQETVTISYEEMIAKCDDLHGKNELAVGILHKIYSDLRKLVHSHCGSIDEDKVDAQNEALPDLLNYSSYETIMKYLEDILNRRLELESVTKEIKSELMHREKELEELNMKCLDLDAVSKLVEEVEGVLEVEDMKIKMNKAPVSCLESLVANLVQKTREAELQVHIAKEGYGAKVMELSELQEKMHYVETLCIEHENEILILKESLRQAEEAHAAACSELHAKTSELEQSEQRVSSIREKLSIAVSKGKGLVVQRDGLKQSLAETSGELEKYLQELKLKDTRIYEVETKLKTYAEAGERVEALESELSYIRNSANTLRESFLLKDSVLQRIEEILEDLDLPEQFHSGDLIEKIDWLSRLAAGNSLSMNDWDQRSSAGGGSYSDAGFVIMDAQKGDIQLQSNSGEDRKNFEELQIKYYRLAEQNEMLEQSLMERNSLVQRWEELVDRIDMPSHLRSMETHDRIEWLGRALVEANHHIDSLQLKIEKYDSYCGLLNADLEESQRRVSAFQDDLRAVTSERERLSDRVEVLMYECEKLSAQARQADLEKDKLYNEMTNLEEKLEQKSSIEEQMLSIEGKIRELQDLVVDALQESQTENLASRRESIDSLELLMRKLIENYTNLSATKSAYVDALDGQHTQEADVTLHDARSRDINVMETSIDGLKKDLEESLHELMHVKEERDRYYEKQISLSGEVEALTKRTEELQELLNQEEQKSASVREKLNVAVRKGKSLVQHRDSLKQTIEEMSNEMEYLKSKNDNWEHAFANFAEKFRDLSSYTDKIEALEPESEYKTSDPVRKLEWAGKLCSGLHTVMASLEQESRKSKRAAELLLAELNEVQERNDAFQEELAKVAGELVGIRKERDLTEAAKMEALSHLEKLSALHMEERKSHFAEIMGLKSSLHQLRKSFIEAGKLLANAFSVDLESFQRLKGGLESCMKGNNAANVVDSSVTGGHDGILHVSPDNKKSAVSVDSWSEMIDHVDDNDLIENCHLLGRQMQKFLVEVDSLKESIHMHLSLAQEQDKTLSELVVSIQRDVISQRESYEAMKKEIGEKDGELVALHENIAYLYESCANSITVIEHGKADLIGNKSASSDLGIFQAAPIEDGILPFSGKVRLISGEHIKTLADRLLLAAKELASIKTEILDANQKEMKGTITDLQRELQEKDVQRDQICMDLVNQIKAAEATANSYLQDLQSSKMREHNLVKQMDEIEAKRKILEQKVNELHDSQVSTAELEEKVRSLTDMLSGKYQEIEALTQALDEEEMQMEELTKKIEELEKVVQQKNLKIENLEASNGKVTKKLSITVSKFDELHQLSASLLAEVENLQTQLRERDAEISFLRQEVTRCTNDVLASQNSNKSSDEILEFLMWVDTMVSQNGVHDMHLDVKGNSQAHEYKEVLHKKLVSLLSEMENLRAVTESKDALLQLERSKVEELGHKAETLEKSLRDKETQLNLLEGAEESRGGAGTSSEIVEVEPVMKKWTVAGTSVTPQVRSLRKGTNDHVAIAVDMDPGSTNHIEDEDDDKVHGFKPLTSSKIVPLPRFTRPLTDMIDGLWVSCDRALMRQPALRLGIIIYWAIMHTLLAFFVV